MNQYEIVLPLFGAACTKYGQNNLQIYEFGFHKQGLFLHEQQDSTIFHGLRAIFQHF